jgi:hypothetical protein
VATLLALWRHAVAPEVHGMKKVAVRPIGVTPA